MPSAIDCVRKSRNNIIGQQCAWLLLHFKNVPIEKIEEALVAALNNHFLSTEEILMDLQRHTTPEGGILKGVLLDYGQ